MKNDGMFWVLAFGFSILLTVASGGAGWPMIVLAIVFRVICIPWYRDIEYAERTIGYETGCAGKAIGCGAVVLVGGLFLLMLMAVALGEDETAELLRQLSADLEGVQR